MADERSEEERREANRVDIGPAGQAPDNPRFRIYENSVDPNQFIPWLKQFLIAHEPILVQAVRRCILNYTGVPFPIVTFVESPLHERSVPLQEWAEANISLDRPSWMHFKAETVVGLICPFSIYITPQGNQMHIEIRGWDIFLIEHYRDMRERLEFAFPVTQVAAGQEQQDIPEQLAGLKPYLRETLQLIVDGLTESQIATWVGKQPKTIQSQKRKLAAALGIEGEAAEKKLKSEGIELGLRPRVETLKKYFSSSRDEKIHP